MLISTSAAIVPSTGTQSAEGTAASDPTTGTAGAIDPPEPPIQLLVLMTYQIISSRIGDVTNGVNISLKKKIGDIESCTDLLNGLSAWDTPPLTPKIPVNPDGPLYQDRINKTDALYLNGINVPDSDYDMVKYTYGDPPKVGYSSLPISNESAAGGNIGQVYYYPDSTTDSKYFVYLGMNNSKIAEFTPAKSPLALHSQSGTDFSNLAPGDLAQDTDTGSYYRISNDKTGIEVTGYPLQKFVQSPDSDVIASLSAQINKKISDSSDLSKKDSLEIQKQQGLLSNLVTMVSNMISSIGTMLNGVATNKL